MIDMENEYREQIRAMKDRLTNQQNEMRGRNAAVIETVIDQDRVYVDREEEVAKTE